MSLNLSAVAEQVHGRLIGADRDFDSVSIDTRSLQSGALYVAIAGERFDGNDFIREAAARGAAGALVSKPADLPLPQVAVDDTRLAFGRMARAWRENFGVPVVAVTGSAGKTTVKELIAGIVGIGRDICVTEGNLNNDIGLPLTLMRVDESHAAVVVELGANHAGEIDYLATLAQPTIGVITNAGAAHLEGFGSIAGVAAAKGELLDHLPMAGAAVLNADDDYFADWRSRSTASEVISFGLSSAADCRPEGPVDLTATGSQFVMVLPDGSRIDVALSLPGEANVKNALAAAAAAAAAGCGPEAIKAGLASAAAVRGRMRVRQGKAGAVVIDDSYNANPSAARAALDYLARLPGRRVFVLGDMLELGAQSTALHAEIGHYARNCADAFYGFGDQAEAATEAFGETATHCVDLAALEDAVSQELNPGTTVLVKGSRSMGLERLVARLAVESEDPSDLEGVPIC